MKIEVDVIAIRIFTDSTCDLPLEDHSRLGIEVMPLTVHFGEESYLDGIELAGEAFYQKLDVVEDLPTTAMVPPQAFIDAFAPHVERGDIVVGIFISSEISGTYHAACIARDAFPEGKIFILDSKVASVGLGLLVTEAAKLRDLGVSIHDMVDTMKDLIRRIRFYAVVDTLKYLRKGGRVSATAAVVGEILGVKPIVTFDAEGTIIPCGKGRGISGAVKFLTQEALKHVPDFRHAVAIGHGGAPERMEQVKTYLKTHIHVKSWLHCEVGAVIGTYGGRGCFGLSYIEE